MDGLEEIDLWTDERKESCSRRETIAVFKELRARPAVHERR